MPVEIKKMLMNISLKGITFPSACAAYSESEIISPARNAPRARERPAMELIQATERTYYHYTQQEKFAISCLCYLVQKKRNYIACTYKSEKNEPNSPKHKLKENISGSCLSCKKRSKDNYQNRSYILKNKLSLIHISEPTRRTPISYAVF